MRLAMFIFILLGAPAAFAQTQTLDCNYFQQSFSLYFQWQSTEITKSGRAVIDQAVANLKDSPATCVVTGVKIDTHTDRSGSEKHNLYLSQAIGQNIADTFMDIGFPESFIHVTAHGETRPQNPTEDGVRSPMNRRADIQISVAAE